MIGSPLSETASYLRNASKRRRCGVVIDRVAICRIVQALVNQQQGKAQKAFVEYQVAHDVHAAAKEAVKAIEPQLMALSGAQHVCPTLVAASDSAPPPPASCLRRL